MRPRDFALIMLMALAASSPSAAADDDGYSSEDYNACLDCHENSGVLGIAETKHADFDDPNSPAAQKQCQSCHGPSAKHMSFPMQVENVHFGKQSSAAPERQNTMCLDCHTEGARQSWQMSPHGLEHVLCNTCHSMHDPDRIIPSKAASVSTCNGSCHQDLFAGAEKESFSHPVPDTPSKEDDFACSTCHNPHGPLDSTRCFECHDLKEETLAEQSAKAQRFHATATERDIDCVRCHKGLAHPIKDLESAEAVLEATAPNAGH